MMIVYQDWLCMWPGTLLIIAQHSVFGYLHNRGYDLHFFPEHHVTFVKLFFHFGIALVHVGVCGYWAWLIKQQTFRETERKTDLLRSRQALSDQLRATETTAARLLATEDRLRKDIVERELAELALRESRERLQMTLGAARMAGWAFDSATDALSFAPETSALFGRTAEQLPETLSAFLDQIHPDDRGTTKVAIRDAIAAGTPFQCVFRLARADGEIRWFSTQGQLVRHANGRARQLLGVVSDITERRRADERHRRLELKVQQSQKLESLGVLAGGIAHDFNNLLVAILGNANLLKDALPASFPDRPLLDAIETASVRAASLTRQMLAYSGGGKFVVAFVDLSDVVRESQALLEAIVTKRDDLRIRLAPRLPQCEVDRNQVVQVLLNLVTNAAESLSGPGAIEIETGTRTVDARWLAAAQVGEDAPPGEYVFLRVADTGTGMSDETTNRMFDPFFTTKFTGRGLGLAVVLGIVRSHGGAIRVDSAVGRGTTVTVLFPPGEAVPAPAPVPAAARAELDWRGSGTILVIDDEDAVNRIARRIFERQGFSSLGAADGPEGLRLFQEHQAEIVLVLVDKTMPGLSGTEVADEIGRLRPDVPIVLTSGYDETASMKRANPDRFAEFLQKPYLAQDLLGVVRRLVGRVASAAG
jgi:PAS domain S-box-containing protein